MEKTKTEVIMLANNNHDHECSELFPDLLFFSPIRVTQQPVIYTFMLQDYKISRAALSRNKIFRNLNLPLSNNNLSKTKHEGHSGKCCLGCGSTELAMLFKNFCTECLGKNVCTEHLYKIAYIFYPKN